MNTEELREFCLKLPGVTEDIKWGHDLCFMLADKMFCVTGMEADASISLKVYDDKFDELTQEEGIIPAPYLARYKWVNISSSSNIKKKQLQELVKGSYELIKAGLSKKKLASLGIS
jgi:predicted DNA-binding protein (MmcQ/YjbR family)